MSEERDRLIVRDIFAASKGGDDGEWFEFKVENDNPEMIGKLVSALSNAARLKGRSHAYVIWGVGNDGELVGTRFDYQNRRVSNQGLGIWLTQRVKPCPALDCRTLMYEGHRLQLLEIPAASSVPVEYDRTAYIRVGDATPRLSDHPGLLLRLVEKLRPFRWELEPAERFATGDRVLELIDYAGFFRLTRQPLPDNRAGIFEGLEADRLLERDVGGRWNITNLGAILFATDLNAFGPQISRRAVRFVKYEGRNRASTVTSRRDETLGYASGFESLVRYLEGLIPTNEEIGIAFRQESPMLPSLAVRELVANALIHQDMTAVGAGPLIELFEDRLEITNPGETLIEPARMIDKPPQSRNEVLAALMRRMRLCEEQGSGLDKVIVEVEVCQLSAPEFRTEDNTTRVSLLGAKSYAEMSQDERIRACYQHAVIKYLSGERMRNISLCERLGIDRRNAAQATGVINRSLEQKLIKPVEDGNPRAGYLPFWV